MKVRRTAGVGGSRVVCLLGMLYHLAAAGTPDLPDVPWLDKPVSRFMAPTIHDTSSDLGYVFAHFIRAAKIPASLEFSEELLYRAERRQKELTFRAQNTTVRHVLAEFVTRWSRLSPIVWVRYGDFLCFCEKKLLDDPTWPLNVRVPGFSVENMTFLEVRDKAYWAIMDALPRGKAGGYSWGAVNSSHPPHAFWDVRERDERRISAQIRAGTGREILCQVARLEPDTFWGAWRADDEDQAGNGGLWEVSFANWVDWDAVSADDIVKRSLGGSPPLGVEGWCWHRDLLNSLRRRGPEGAAALIRAYRYATGTRKTWLISHLRRDQSAWPDAAAVAARFAKEELTTARDPALIEQLRHLLEDAQESMKLGSGAERPSSRGKATRSSGPRAAARRSAWYWVAGVALALIVISVWAWRVTVSRARRQA